MSMVGVMTVCSTGAVLRKDDQAIRSGADHQDATHRFESVIENAVFTASREVNFDSDAITENTQRIPTEFVPRMFAKGAVDILRMSFLDGRRIWGHASVAKLDQAQAMYYFSRVYLQTGGTETGLGEEPQATFYLFWALSCRSIHMSIPSY